ncbi:DUF1168 domain protein [Aspergillus taichungensis]|uniref:DUF1168 domain protein n=1 Tax=Aspergillus taichungensis TaxID=482145 RepID=A0A2J5I6Y0_9EURO|nr:DUF1168 domain protein [Aspergillus taichungensis]
MSEPGPESVPTSADPRSKRPVKRRAITPHLEQASQINSLFRDPTKDIRLPGPSRERTAGSMPAPPEIVANVQGSSAGAGSGEFHVYKASRRREYERLRLMQGEVDKEKGDEEWERKQEEIRRKDEEKTEKNRKRRGKKNAARKNKKGPNGQGADASMADQPANVASGPALGGSVDGVQDTGSEGVDRSVETPGVIIHDD